MNSSTIFFFYYLFRNDFNYIFPWQIKYTIFLMTTHLAVRQNKCQAIKRRPLSSFLLPAGAKKKNMRKNLKYFFLQEKWKMSFGRFWNLKQTEIFDLFARIADCNFFSPESIKDFNFGAWHGASCASAKKKGKRFPANFLAFSFFWQFDLAKSLSVQKRKKGHLICI